jgi:hypothetical protein
VPPNGAVLAAPVSGLFQLTIPARASSSSRSNFSRSGEINPQERPKRVALARAIASSKSS